MELSFARSGFGIALWSGPGVTPSFFEPWVPNSDRIVQILSVPVSTELDELAVGDLDDLAAVARVRAFAEPFSTIARAFALRRACFLICGDVRLSGLARTWSDDAGAPSEGTRPRGGRRGRGPGTPCRP